MRPYSTLKCQDSLDTTAVARPTTFNIDVVRQRKGLQYTISLGESGTGGETITRRRHKLALGMWCPETHVPVLSSIRSTPRKSDRNVTVAHTYESVPNHPLDSRPVDHSQTPTDRNGLGHSVASVHRVCGFAIKLWQQQAPDPRSRHRVRVHVRGPDPAGQHICDCSGHCSGLSNFQNTGTEGKDERMSTQPLSARMRGSSGVSHTLGRSPLPMPRPPPPPAPLPARSPLPPFPPPFPPLPSEPLPLILKEWLYGQLGFSQTPRSRHEKHGG